MSSGNMRMVFGKRAQARVKVNRRVHLDDLKGMGGHCRGRYVMKFGLDHDRAVVYVA